MRYKKCLKFYDSLLAVPIEEINPHVLDNLNSEWRKDLKKYKSTRISFIKELEALTYIFNWYQENYDEARLASPFKDRHFRRIKIREPETTGRKFMTDDEAALFLNELKKDSFVFYILALTQLRQMMRVSEVCAMKWKNLNFKTRTYTMCDHVIWPRVKGLKPYIDSGTKTVKSGEGHELNLFREVVEALAEVPRSDSELIFHDDGKVLTYR